MKRYSAYMDEITPDELYEGLLAYGMFSEKIPPIFTSEAFYRYCLTLSKPFQGDRHDYITFDSIRNINIPRQISIPNPMAYHRLCVGLRDNWEHIKQHFHTYTDPDTHLISRIRIRKKKESKALFKMNYSNWRIDGSPEDDLVLGNRYVVHADISTCFPSIYTHSLCWAFDGKKQAKQNKSINGIWYNDIDDLCQRLRCGETHGLMIGPHASNLLAECILIVVDRHLFDEGWRYIRNIDDYTCYVKSEEDAKKFIIHLKNELKAFDLFINSKKTFIEPLPITSEKSWKRKLTTFQLVASHEEVNYIAIRNYFDLAIELMRLNDNDAAILNYAIKVLSGKKLTYGAKQYFIKHCIHLAVIYPYLLSLLDTYVFVPCKASRKQIESFSNIIYDESNRIYNYEGMCYAIYFSLKYNFPLKSISASGILDMDSCLVRLFGMLYYKKTHDTKAWKLFRDDAKQLQKMDMDRYWIYIYETLTYGNLKGEWEALKKAKISFLKQEVIVH